MVSFLATGCISRQVDVSDGLGVTCECDIGWGVLIATVAEGAIEFGEASGVSLLEHVKELG